MKITLEEVEHVARLARLRLTPKEKEVFTRQLGDILSFMEKLNRLDTSQVEPSFHVLPLQNVFREDEVKPSLPQDKALGNAPEVAQGCFRVPKILE